MLIGCNKYEIPSKLIKLIVRTLQDTKARVKVNQNYTEKFEISTRVKQGDPLLATLFSIVIDDIVKQLELRGNISTCLKQCSAYADDINLYAPRFLYIGQAFCYSPENAFYVFNQQIYFII